MSSGPARAHKFAGAFSGLGSVRWGGRGVTALAAGKRSGHLIGADPIARHRNAQFRRRVPTAGQDHNLQFDNKRNVRPWDKTLTIKVVRGFLREGDQIIVRFGDRRKGSPGIRVQTFREKTFEFRVLVDALATYQYTELAHQPTIEIVPGPPVLYRAILPTLRGVGEPFRLCLRGDDKWGNPSDRCRASFGLRSSHAVEGLPQRVEFKEGDFAVILKGLSVAEPGDVVVELFGGDGTVVATSNPRRIERESSYRAYWGDLHGQSEETIGTNSALDYFEFARDRAFLDVACHQGNDFQITNDFWEHLNRISAEFDEAGRFVAIPGYKWSGKFRRSIFGARTSGSITPGREGSNGRH